MINYIEKGKYLHKAIRNAGHSLHQHDGVWIADDDVAVQSIIDSFDSLLAAQTEAITAIKLKANELILSYLPIWKQNNLQAESTIILAKPIRGLGDLNQAELDRLTEIESYYVYPYKVRAKSDIEEAHVLAQTDWTLVDIEAAKANLDAIV